MRKFALAAICVIGLAGPVNAQVSMGPQLFIPSPVGMVITVGKWIWDVSTQEQVYYIEVAGEGATVAEAKNNGFRLAVEQAIGTIIASESEANNGQLTRDEIISYASGHVDKFEIASQQATPIGVQTVMKVWVRRSSLSNRLLNRSEKVGEVDGARASVQLSTIGAERATGDQLVASVLRDFPKRAFDIDLKNTELKYGNRQGVLEVPFRLSWNKDYLASLWAALEATAQKSSNPMSQVSISPGGWFRGFGGTARYDDYAKYTLVNSVLVGSRPAVLITIKNAGNRAISRQCYFWPELDHNDGYVVRPNKFVFIAPYGNSTTINGGFRLDAVALIPTTPELLATASRVDIDIVPKISCPN